MTVVASFHELRFPPEISFGAIGGPGFNTTVNTLSSGAEKRNQNWQRFRSTYDVSHKVKTYAQFITIYRFWLARRGRAYGFRFKDWNDYRLPFWNDVPGDLDALPVLFTTDGSTAAFQIVKFYPDDLNPYVRQIFKPVPDSIILYDNGVLTADYTIDVTTGIVTLGVTTAATTGDIITGSLEFDTPVRFDTDDMKASIDDWDSYSWQSITMTELKFLP